MAIDLGSDLETVDVPAGETDVVTEDDRDARIAELEKRVDYLYDTLKAELEYHGHRNGPESLPVPSL